MLVLVLFFLFLKGNVHKEHFRFKLPVASLLPVKVASNVEVFDVNMFLCSRVDP